jgi:hypothetical protein
MIAMIGIARLVRFNIVARTSKQILYMLVQSVGGGGGGGGTEPTQICSTGMLNGLNQWRSLEDSRQLYRYTPMDS